MASSKIDQIRTQLANKVFTPYGKSVSIYRPTGSISYNSRGERDDTTSYTSASITIVDYDIMFGRKSHEQWGDLQEGDREAVAAYDTDLDIDDYIQIDGQMYKVNMVEKPALPTVAVIIFRLSKTTDTVS